jgi:hypothetical protein
MQSSRNNAGAGFYNQRRYNKRRALMLAVFSFHNIPTFSRMLECCVAPENYPRFCLILAAGERVKHRIVKELFPEASAAGIFYARILPFSGFGDIMIRD